jgi:hypothetical protein
MRPFRTIRDLKSQRHQVTESSLMGNKRTGTSLKRSVLLSESFGLDQAD